MFEQKLRSRATMKLKHRLLAFLLLLCTLSAMIPITALASLATDGEDDAMNAIESELADFKLGETVSVADDGYIGIPVEVSVYFDKENNTAKAGSDLDATPVVIYVVNTAIERIGTDSDVDIIKSMLERGYAVVVFDYLGSSKAVSPDLDWSVQGLRANVTNGTYLSDRSVFPSGSYVNNLVAPAGYNVEFNHVFWEIDKHGADGTFDKIVEVWNNDFRGYKGSTVIKWVDESGERKSTQNAFDGTEPVWYSDAAGTVEDAENGTYIRIKHTLATCIEDCVKKDGTPIDLSLYMHIIYPTSPTGDVPVMTLACSAGHLAQGTQTADRPQMNGFLFSGYAAVTFDYGYTPMARDDHYGYFDGSTPTLGSVTGDNVTYSIHWYNESKINTAAMRYIRYLSASDHDKYSFKDDAIGVYGNSKGGWATRLGEEHPELLPERRIVPGHSGETRYESGKTETVGCIDGGEEQPWLTYNGVTLDSGADFIYSSCGGGAEQITSSHCPMYISCHTGDGTYYGTSNQFVNVCRSMDVPALWFEVEQGHTFASAADKNYGVDTYSALFTFAGYYLKGDAVSVVYAQRDADIAGLPSNAPIVVKFSGAVAADELAAVTVKSAGGKTVNGTWSSAFGGTEWTFTPATLTGDTQYTLTVPATLKGDNGKAMEAAYTYTFNVGHESALSSDALNSVKTSAGTYVYFDMPDTSSVGFNVDIYTLRIGVSNPAVNRLGVYALTGFDPSSPDSAVLGNAVGSVAVSGAGQYDIELAEYLEGISSGTSVAFLIKQEKTAGETAISTSPLATSSGDMAVSANAVWSLAAAPDGTAALKVESVKLSSTASNNAYYTNPMTYFSNSNIVKKASLAQEDIGRTFTISFKVYDTVSRIFTVKLESCTNSSKKVADYNGHFYNFYSKAGEWTEFSFEYTVYEPTMADLVGDIRQRLTINTTSWGVDTPCFYIRDVNSVETVTDVTLDGCELLLGNSAQKKDPLETAYGKIPEKYADAEQYPYVLFSSAGVFLAAGDTLVNQTGTSGVLSTLQNSSSITSFPNDDSVLLVRDDVTFDTVYDNFSFLFGKLLIDLDGHTFTCSGLLFNACAKRCGSLSVTVKNGTVLQGGSRSLISYSSVSSTNYPWETLGERSFDFNFVNVTLGYASGASAKPFFSAAWSAPTPVLGSITLEGCTIDLTQNAPSGTYTLLNANTDANSMVALDISVKGGTIKATSMEGITVGSASGDGSFKFIKDKSGSYTKAVLPSSAAAPTGTYTADGNSVCFVSESVSDGMTTYKLDVDPLQTPYGAIPSQYASVEDYPWVLFQDNGNGTYTFKKAESDVFYDNSAIMIAARSINAIIYMRRDCTITKNFNNLAFASQNGGTNTFDLGGNTLTANAAIAASCKKNWNKYVTFKNGTIVTASRPLLSFTLTVSDVATTSGVGQKYDIKFEDITFKRVDGASAKSPIVEFVTASATYYIDLTFNNCTFDMTGTYPTAGITLLPQPTDTGTVATVKVNGGVIKADTVSGLSLTSQGNTLSSVVFGGYDGETTKLILASGATAPEYTVTTADGQYVYAFKTTSADGDVYTLLSAKELETPYGNIPIKYASKELYPFAQFKDNGNGTYTFLEAEKDIFADGSRLMIKARSQTTVIYMRRDYTKEGASPHTNLVHINGKFTLDMNGKTLTVLSGTPYEANAKLNEYTTKLIFKNGTVVMNSGAFIKFTSSWEDEALGQVFDITFEDMTFKYASGATSNRLSVAYSDGERIYVTNVTYNGCVIDLANAPYGAVVFELGSSDGKTTGKLSVNGGRILGFSPSTATLLQINNTQSSATFGAYSGAYTTLTSTGALGSDMYDTADGGKATFTETETAGTYVLTVIAKTEGYCGKNVKWSFDEETGVLTISGKGAMKQYSATSMPWYHLASKITKVVIGEGVTSIGKNTFNNTKAGFVFTEITLPSTLTSIGNYAFYDCTSLTNVNIPASVNAIGKFAFRGTALKDHTLGRCGKTVDWMLDNAGTLIIYGDGAMYDFGSKTAPWASYRAQIKNVVICDGVTSIGNCAFYECASIESVKLASTVTSIGNYAFYSCKALTEMTIPAAVSTIGAYAFRKCTALTTATFESDGGWSYGDASADISADALKTNYKSAWTRG